MTPSSSAARTLALTSVAVFVVSLDGTVLFVAFPAIRATFAHVSAAQLSWVLNAYTIVFGALLVPAGRIADRVGRKRIFLLGLALFSAASTLCGVAPSAGILIAARALQALGAALLLPSSLALVLHAFPAARRASAVALWGAVGALAAAIGPSLGSLIIQSWGWRWVFYINVPVGIAAVVRGNKLLRESRDEAASELPDLSGLVLLIAGVALIALGIVEEAAGASSIRAPSPASSGEPCCLRASSVAPAMPLRPPWTSASFRITHTVLRTWRRSYPSQGTHGSSCAGIRSFRWRPRRLLSGASSLQLQVLYFQKENEYGEV